MARDASTIQAAIEELSVSSERVGYAMGKDKPVHVITALVQERNAKRDALIAMVEDHGREMYDAGTELGRGEVATVPVYEPGKRKA